ncbi:MAG: hypothetical protein KAI24_24890 [Planctomycetes bacterium]|nr:hypothetical protein [Planctomycetota bacterium]
MRAALSTFLLCVSGLLAQVPDPTPDASFEMAPGTRYDPAIPTLDEVTGHAWGTEISAHRDVERYVRALERAAPDRVEVVGYGQSWQGRTLYYVVVSSPENHRRLPRIRETMQQLADPRRLERDAADALVADLPAVGWLANCVHGDEPSGTDAALYLLYHLLAAQDDPIVAKVLAECVVLIDPLQNPDGRDRFVFYTRGARGRWPDPTPTAAEHSQPWPSGRTNHAMFDMNRDWFAMTQPETEGRVRAFLDWWPLVYVDLHEMGGNSTYYFPPPAQPINESVTASQRAWLNRYGRNNARWFDRFGFDYFTREAYDAFYPGYGDSWPMAHGSVGMTFEMASARGLVYRRTDEGLLRYRDGVRRHFVASLATLETLAEGRREALSAFVEHRRDGLLRGRNGPVFDYVLPARGDRTRLARLANLLLRQGVEVHVAEEPLVSELARPAGSDGERARQTFPAGSFVVRMVQPASTLARLLLQPHFDMDRRFLDEQKLREARRQRGQFYDLTAWSLPLLFGVECCESAQPCVGRMQLLRPGEASSGAAPLRAAPPKVAYVIAWGDNGAAAMLVDLLRNGVKVKCIDEPFQLGERALPAGSLVVRVHAQDAARREGLQALMARLAATHGVTPHCADSSWIEQGPSFGTREGHALRAPRVAMAWDRPANTYSAGWLRYLLEQRYGLPVTAVRTHDLTRTDLDRFTVLVLPDGRYGRHLRGAGADAVKGFVRRGGVLVTLGAATRWLAEDGVGLLATGPEPRDGPADKNKGKDKDKAEGDGAGAADAGSDQGAAAAFDYDAAIRPDEEPPPSTPGAILRVVVDDRHWLGFGYRGAANVVHDSSNILTPVKLDRGTNVARYAAQDLLQAGFLWEQNRRQLPDKAYLVHQPHGRGHVVAFAEDPNVRAFADGLNLMLMNAVLLTAGR